MGWLERFRGLFRRAPSPPGPPAAPAALPIADPTPPPEAEPAQEDGELDELSEDFALFGSAERVARFQREVASWFEGRGIDAEFVPGMIRIRSGELKDVSFGLGNVAQLCAQADEQRWPELVASHFARTHETLSRHKHEIDEVRAFHTIRDRLVVRLWENSDLPDEIASQVVREDVPGLLSVLCVDYPEAVGTVRRDEAAGWGRTDDELFDIAADNCVALAKPARGEEPLGNGQKLVTLMGESFYVSSLALRIEEVVGDGHGFGQFGAFVAMPVRGVLLLLPFHDLGAMQALARLMFITTGMHRDGPGSVSRRVYWRHRQRWHEVPYEIAEQQLNVMPPEELVEVMNGLAGEGGAE